MEKNNQNQLLKRAKQQVINDPKYSIRRFLVDSFFIKNISRFSQKDLILDIGGLKENKKGVFNINDFKLNVEYANIDETSQPDYLCDATDIPVDDNKYDGIILSETLEHVPNPYLVLKEACRVLKPGGIVLITTPFQFHVHADPYDYGRYTGYWYKEKMKELGFQVEILEKQGLFYSTLGNMIKLWANAYPGNRVKRKFIQFISKRITSLALKERENQLLKGNWFFSSNTTGFGVVGRKTNKLNK